MHKPDGEDGFQNISQKFLMLLSNYGWFIVGAIAVYIMFWDRLVQYWRNSLKQDDDIGWGMKNEEGLQEARKKMQERIDVLAQEHAEQMKQMEAEKRQQRLEELEEKAPSHGHGHRLGDGKAANPPVTRRTTSGRARLRDDTYNPLSGSGGGGGFRSSRNCGPRGG
ncbi:selenoprotein S-like [Paramacrobiotus metropolitanus]|uniref:selenoprotein S-like n=1 Tax=Paramacrobiotus metropolitanus TaxID=2943436 RepID=UPI00244576EC|nr:selenoprotein S-like [Paramacrobiotus metropolitanus]